MISTQEFINVFNNHMLSESVSNILIIAAHPDDEIIGAGGILSYIKDSLSIVTVTDGSPKKLYDALSAGFTSREAYSAARFIEQESALKLVDYNCSRCIRLGLTDQEVSFNLPGLSYKIKTIFETVKPGYVLTHAFEGGHPDHDAVAFSVWAASEMMKMDHSAVPEILEFPCYHGDGVSERMLFGFISDNSSINWNVNLSDTEIALKTKMINCFTSQWNTLSRFPLTEEYYRISAGSDFSATPHQGVLLYEFYDWGMSVKDWLNLSGGAKRLLGLEKQL